MNPSGRVKMDEFEGLSYRTHSAHYQIGFGEAHIEIKNL